MKKLLIQTISITAALAVSSLAASTVPQVPTLAEEKAEEKVEEVKKEVITYVNRWTLPNATENERVVLEAIQDRGITDKYAIATIMGNIKQESRFHSNICEGGARIHYSNCHRGGYGLIQWTTVGRYNGLGTHARRIGHDPSTTTAQISYLFTEHQWKSIEPALRSGGRSISYYMNKAYRWLGWGHHGRRTQYSHQYAARLVSVKVPAK